MKNRVIRRISVSKTRAHGAHRPTAHPRFARARAWIAAMSIAIAILLIIPSASMAQSAVAVAEGRGDTVRFSLTESRARAVRANPDLQAVSLDTAIAIGVLRQDAVLFRFNPAIDVLAAGGGKGVEPSVSQEIEVFGQRGLRVASGSAGVVRARAAVTDVVRLTIGAVDRAFYRAFAAIQRNALANDVLARNQRLAAVANRQLLAGEISRLDYNLVIVESGRSRAQALASRRELAQALIEYTRLLGLPSTSIVVPQDSGFVAPGLDNDSASTLRLPLGNATVDSTESAYEREQATPSLNLDSLTALALRRRPDLLERAAAARALRADARVARREALPNVVVRGTSERENGTRRSFRPGVGVTIPIFNLNRGEVEARSAGARQAELQRGAVAVRIRAEIASVASAYSISAAEVRTLASTVLAPARQNSRLLETAYREGKVGIAVLLLIRNQVVAAEQEYWNAWLTEREARANLDEATAGNLDGVVAARTNDRSH